jgi:hypothetical protein
MKVRPLFLFIRSKFQTHRRCTMKGKRILTSMLVLVLLLTLAVGLSTAASALRRDSGQAPLSTSFTYHLWFAQIWTSFGNCGKLSV